LHFHRAIHAKNHRNYLVANRGEIALRVMRSAKELGIKTVAVYSEADRNAMHVRFADEAVCIGAPASSESYLRIDKIMAAAKQTGAMQFIPATDFYPRMKTSRQACEDNGIIFVGPSPKSIELMGSKLAAKAAVAKFNVPLVPGTSEPITDIKEAKKIAAKIGYPVLIKASAGGGGKGMRVVKTTPVFRNKWNEQPVKQLLPLATEACSLKNTLRNPATSSSRSLATSMEMSFICSNGSVRFNGDTRR
jgi:acetyl-CoA carboxylase biotin carboxylase subunit